MSIGKKIVILHRAHWEQVMGGAELQISYLVNELIRRGYEVHYIYEDNGKCIENKVAIHLHPLKKFNIRKWFGEILFLYRKSIIECLKKIRPDIIYTRCYSSWSGFAGLYAHDNNIKHIWAIASDYDLRPLKRYTPLKILNCLENYFALKSFKYASYILTQNDFQQKRLRTMYNRQGIKILPVSPGVDKSKLIKGENVVVLWIANLKPVKRPELFIALASNFRNSDSIRFTMIGRSGKKYADVIYKVQQNQQNFRYRGEISNDEVDKNLCTAHLLVNTSEVEGFSNTFVQAWMHKVIVLSMKSNPDNVITKYGIGFICPTIDELIRKIELLINNEELREKMAEKAYQYAINNHTLNNLNKIFSLL